MTLSWQKDDRPRWDADRQRLFGELELASVGLVRPADDAPIADEWWRVTDSGELVGYGWLDSEWGDAQIAFLVAPSHRGAGVGQFVLDRLEDEARRRGLNYIYNVVPDSHPDRSWMAHWLSLHGFRDGGRGELRRQVRGEARTSRGSR